MAMTARVQALLDEVRAQPLRRPARRALLTALWSLGRLEDARAAAWDWLETDREQEAAVVAYADALGRLGAGREALRAYASLAVLAPRRAGTHRMLAAMFEAKNERDAACSHRRAVASLAPQDGQAALDLARCLAGAGDWEGARQVAAVAAAAKDHAAAAEARRLIDDLVVRRPPTPSAATAEPRGDIVVEARWEGGEDLDVTLVLPSGERFAVGAPQPAGRRAVERPVGQQGQSEWLALARAGAGRYAVEIGRYAAAGAKAPIRGEVRVRALRTERSFGFEVQPGAVARLTELTVTRPPTPRFKYGPRFR
jgi:tetratricopeptide (TPR) repeat protein